VYIRPHRPRLNGKVKRSHRIDEGELFRLLDGVVIDDTSRLNEKVRESETVYSCSQSHAGLNSQTFYERFGEEVWALCANSLFQFCTGP
jgi:transposase